MTFSLFAVFQAFLEFEDESVAQTFVSYYSKMTCQIRGKQVYTQFSQHKELKTDQSHSFQVSLHQSYSFQVSLDQSGTSAAELLGS